MSVGLVQAAYIIAALLFIMSLAGLSKHETAKAGCWYGIVGMGIALVATIFRRNKRSIVDNHCNDYWCCNWYSPRIKS